MRYFITGAAGFIGFNLAKRLLDEGHDVAGYDGMTPYYDVRLKEARHAILTDYASYRPHIGMLEDGDTLNAAVAGFEPEVIVHLAAQVGVRYSLENPRSYISSNVDGSFNLLEAARAANVRHLMLASTSSIYGGNTEKPSLEIHRTDYQASLYAATKKAMEALSHSYAHLWKVPTTCFRFFTVYGPWGRPDMALFKFVDAIAEDRPIDVYGNGEMQRDFTYVDDLVEGIVRLSGCAPREGEPFTGDGVEDSLSPVAPWRTVNLAGGASVELRDFIAAIEKAMGTEAKKNMMPMQKGDVRSTHASPALLQAMTGFIPRTGVEDGVKAFVDWYLAYRARIA